MAFENNSKMIALSSASYTFENLYKTYKEWIGKIRDKETTDASYFMSQMGYESLPKEMIDTTIIEEARSGGVSHSSFQREYCAQFTDGSDSYFSAKIRVASVRELGAIFALKRGVGNPTTSSLFNNCSINHFFWERFVTHLRHKVRSVCGFFVSDFSNPLLVGFIKILEGIRRRR